MSASTGCVSPHSTIIARRFTELTIIGAHLGNPDYTWAAEIGRWNPHLYFDLSGSTLIKLQENYQTFKSIRRWLSIASPQSPKSNVSKFEKQSSVPMSSAARSKSRWAATGGANFQVETAVGESGRGVRD